MFGHWLAPCGRNGWGERKKLDLMMRDFSMFRAWFAVISVLGLLGCGDSDTSFLELNSGGTDPYCNDISAWNDEVSVRAVYSDADAREQIEVVFETSQEVVEMGGAYRVAFELDEAGGYRVVGEFGPTDGVALDVGPGRVRFRPEQLVR